MTKIEKIKTEILNYSVSVDIVEVEFEDYILEIDLKYFKNLKINKDNLANIIYNHYTKKE